MPDYQFMTEHDEYIDVVADGNFEGQLGPSEMLTILEVISSTVRVGTEKSFFLEGLRSVEISQIRISLGVRFRREGIEQLNPQERDEIPRKMSKFLMCCFACVDKIHALSETPFPPNFRDFADMSKWL